MSNPASSAPTSSAPTSSAPVDGAPTPGQTAAPTATPAEVRKMKLKIDNADVEMSESEVIALAQKGRGADRKFQEAAQLRKEAEQTAAFLKANPREALAKLGIDVRKFSEETLMEILTQEQMSPEQRKAQDMEKKLRGYEKAEKDAKDTRDREEAAALEGHHMKTFDDMFVKALGESGLPKTQYTVKRMAELQLVNIRKGLNLDATQLAKLVREDYMSEQKALYGAADGDALLELLGPEIVKKLSKAQIKKLKTAAPQYSKPTPDREPSSGEPSAQQNWKEFQRKNRGR